MTAGPDPLGGASEYPRAGQLDGGVEEAGAVTRSYALVGGPGGQVVGDPGRSGRPRLGRPRPPLPGRPPWGTGPPGDAPALLRQPDLAPPSPEPRSSADRGRRRCRPRRHAPPNRRSGVLLLPDARAREARGAERSHRAVEVVGTRIMLTNPPAIEPASWTGHVGLGLATLPAAQMRSLLVVPNRRPRGLPTGVVPVQVELARKRSWGPAGPAVKIARPGAPSVRDTHRGHLIASPRTWSTGASPADAARAQSCSSASAGATAARKTTRSSLHWRMSCASCSRAVRCPGPRSAGRVPPSRGSRGGAARSRPSGRPVPGCRGARR